MGELAKMPNIGADTERQLIASGIETAEKLREVGSEAAWLLLLARDPSACIHRIYGLEGAIRGIRKSELPEEVKERLRNFVNKAKGTK